MELPTLDDASTGNKQQRRWISTYVAFFYSQFQNLFQIPTKVTDNAVRKPFGCLAVQKLLQFIPIESIDPSLAKLRDQVETDPLLVAQSR